MASDTSRPPNRYSRLIEQIFDRHYEPGKRVLEFDRDEIAEVANEIAVTLPKNLGDIIYSFRYRTDLSQSIRSKAPTGEEWVILPAGRGRYQFVSTRLSAIRPTPGLVETKIPDSTPGLMEMYALSDEQSLLAKLRYNRLIDIFTGVTCYSLQSHLRSSVPGMGQVETDEVYIGVDRRGAHYVFPVQAKGGRDRLGIVQIGQDFALCEHKFGSLICRPIAAQFMEDKLIALFEFEQTEQGFGIAQEKHYRLVPPEA